MSLTGNPPFKGGIDAIVGRVSIYIHDQPALLNQRVCKIIAKSPLISLKYLYYWLSYEKNTLELANRCTGSANQANISSNDILKMDIELPKIEIQQHIVDIVRKEANNAYL